MKDFIIYSDLDGVIVDFNRGFKKLSNGVLPSDYEQTHTLNKFWELIDSKGSDFWVNLDWMSDGRQYWDYIKKYNPILLSSPSRSESSRVGKTTWVKKHLPGTKLILKYSARKHEIATPNSILIDDRADIIERWGKAGGIGILHINTPNTIKQLQNLGI